MGTNSQNPWEAYKKGNYTPNSSNTKKTTASKSASTNAWEDYKKKTGFTVTTQSGSAQNWADSAREHLKETESYLSKWHAKEDSGYSSIKKKNAALLDESYYWLREYSNDPESKAYIKEIISALDNVRTSVKGYSDHYGKWGTEDEYNTARKNYDWQQKYKDSSIEDLRKLTLDDEEEQKWVKSYIQYLDDEEKGNYDLVAGQKEIDDLKAQLAQMEQDNRYNDLQQRINPAKPTEPTRQDIGYNPHTMWQQGTVQTSGITEEEKLRQLIAQKQQYLNQAKHIQESNAYADTVNNADFDQFDDFVESYDVLYNWINDAQFREEFESLYKDSPSDVNSDSRFTRKNYDQINENEIAIFNYYYAKGGKKAAKKYLDNIQETLNKRKAEEVFGTVKDNVAAELVFGVAAGVNQFGTNVMNNFKFKADYIPQSAYQIASGMVREDLADNGKLPEWMGENSLAQIAYDAVTTTANMAPSILVGIATSGTAGIALMGLSAAGGAYQQALNEGFDKAQARGYSILVGASEAVLEKVLGGISAVGGNALGLNAVKNIANADNALKAIAKRLGASAWSEFKEEYLQEVLDPVFRNLMMHTGEDVKLVSYEAIYSGILGALTGAFMEAPFAIYGETKTAITGRKIKEAGGVNDLAKIGNTFAPETVAYKLAGKVTNDTGAYTIGQLFNEVNARLTDQNISEIAEVLMKEGMGENEAKQNARNFAYVVEGGTMPDAFAAAIEADTLLASAARQVLFEDNTTWNQRSQGYRDVLMKLAEDKVKGKTAPTNEASVPVDNTAEAKTESGAEGNVEPAKYGSIQNIKNGKVTVKMTDGSEVDLKDADLDPEDSVRIETIASIDGISAEDASGIFGILKAGSKNSQYDAIGAREAYRYGYYGLTEKMLDENGTFSKSLTPEQRKAVYEIGNKARQQNVESKTFRKTDAKKAPGKVHYDGDRTVLNERQQVSLKAMDRIASALGVQIYIFESKVGENGKRIGENGWYDPADSSIHIDLYAGQDGGATMLFTLSHELTHYIRHWSDKKFYVLADFLMEEYGKKGVNVSKLIREQQNKAKRNGRTISYDTAYEEVVADSMEMMLSDGNVMKRLEKLKAKDKDLWSQIKRFIDDMAAKIRSVYKDMKPDSKEAEFVMEMGDTIYRLQELFTEGLMDASENFQTAEKNTTEDGGDILRSLREFEDGTRFVDVQMDANTFDGMSVSEMNRTAKDILMKKFAGKVIGIDNRVFVNGDSVNEYLHPSKNIDDTTRRAKLTAAGELDNLLDAGTALPNRPDGENGHIHPDAIDFSYYKTIFKVGNEYFEGIVNIKNIKRGKLLKDVTKIRNITQDIVSSYGDNPKSNFLRDVSMYSIRDDSGKVNEKSTEAVDISYDEATESVAPSVLFSERTWTESDYVQERDAAAKEIAKAIGVTEKKAKAYIDSVNSVAKMIADDRTRLDYFSSPNRSSFVSNVEYGGSFDFSTLCKKRRLLTGTFTAIQKALPNTALTANEILDIRNRMKDAGLEVSCGLCYVEGSRANMGQFAKEFLRLYKQYYPDAWQPNMADVNTPDGIEWVRINHPECYEQYEYFWNHYGTLKAGDKNLFASQQKPKLYQLHTEYKGEILKKFKDDDNVEEKNLNGGIRLQSFSDFEIVHLIDTMQIIMDMSRVGLAGQAYTKVPDFAWALGDTGLKINLSLIAKGVDENGKLIFDDVEGMPIADAMKLRDRYSANVGTILVAFNDEQLKAAMADDRVDFIIPFHRSQWKKSQYSAMGLPAKTKDYTFMQNEKFIKPQYHEYRGRMVKDKATNYMPNEYWDFSKSGKENAEAYLEMCARNNKRPKFYKLLANNGDGSYSLKADGSTDGYWKLLIDFKMYDNAGNGSPQQAVKPEFNMDEATRMLNEYSGGHSNFPVAQGIVDEFVSEYKDSHKGVMYSSRDTESVTARDLLSGTDVATIKNEVAKKKLADYQKILEVMNAEDQKLREIRAEIKELSFAKGARDTKKLKDLKFEAIKINNHISVYEGQLQRMEKELQSVVKRERAKVVKEAEKRDKSVLAKEWMDAQVKQSETLREYRETRAALRQQESDTAVIEKEFIRIAKEYEKLNAKSETAAGRSQRTISELRTAAVQNKGTISELRTALKNEVKKHRADEKMWMAEFGRLMREYDAADRSIDRLEQKIERQKAVAKERVENRNKTAMRHKIQNVVKELNSLLLSNDKKRHAPDNLKKAVAEALDLVNMDTVGAEERAAKYADLIAKEQAKANPDQDVIDSYISTMEDILLKGEKMGQRLNELHAAYEEIQNSDDPDIANGYDPVIAGAIKELSATIGNTSIKNMSIEQLSDVYDVYRAVLTRVRDANKAMAENIKASIEELAKSTIREVQSVGGSNKYRISALDAVRKFDWDNLKPVYAMERIGSSTLTEVFNNVRAGEDVWARDVSEARTYYLEKSKKYGYDKWDFDKKYRFESNSGIPFELTLEQMMSLYAYSKREQAGEHLRLGGFVFDSNIETTKEKDGKRSILKYKVNTADAHQITPEIMADIIGNLTREQAMFVDEMQDYLSTVMGAKGNEVTSKMYGIKLFKEKFYFPLKSAKQFMFEQNEVSGEVRIKNSGFTNKVVTNANNPVILSNFMDVWSGHVNDMSMYHAFTLPLEDFNRVFNYNTPKKDGIDPVSVKGTIQNAYSPAAVQYVKNLITDLNGGARTDSTTGVINKLTGLFKKGAVFASLSVVVQQPSAIARAAALIDTKYFIGPKIDQKRHNALWNEVKQYAPVALIKEMGYFDTNMGKSTQDYITGKEYSGFSEQMKALVTDSNYRDEILSKAPAFADEVAWCGIWEAVKRETKAKHPSMDTKSEAFLKLAGQRFTEVITKTQVYDSVLARSANMRSKDTGMKMATAFMAEPTTSINMIEDAIMKGKRGDKRYARTAIGAVIASQILNSILVSFVYAARDDDEDETYLEKYIGSLAGGIIDGLNPATYIPFIKDIVSIVQGYDVERSDMAVVSDLWNAWKSLSNENVSMYRKVEGFAGSIAQIFGLPVKNIMRDVRGIYNAIMTITGAEKATGAGVKYAIGEAITGKTVSNKEQLYEARMAGDTAHTARVEARYDDMDSADAAVRAAIKDEFMADKIDEATALNHMVQYAGMDGSEAHWTMDAWKYRKAVGSDDGYGKYGRFHDAVRSGNNLSEVIKEYTDNGVKTSTLTGEITDEFKPVYVEASSSERASMKTKLVNAYVACGMDRDDAEGKLESWDFEAEYGFAYSDRKEAYLTSKVSRAVLTDILIDRGYEEDDADAQIDAYEWEAEGFEDITTSAVRNYNTYAEPAGIPKSVFIGFWEFDNSTENDVDPTTGKKIAYSAVKKIMAYIDSLNLTDAQKDALAKSAGWADKTIKKYKLW